MGAWSNVTSAYSIRGAPRRVRARIGAALLACMLPYVGAGAVSPQDGVSEAALKAAIVANLFLFVEWPDASSGLRLCVAGRGETADAVLAVQGGRIKGRVVETMRLAAPDALPGRQCKILFIPAGAGRRAVEFAQAAAGSAILIVAEDDVLSIEEAHVVLALDERRPALSINLTEARRAGLNISSRLLRLARRVL